MLVGSGSDLGSRKDSWICSGVWGTGPVAEKLTKAGCKGGLMPLMPDLQHHKEISTKRCLGV
jgi:hypothetical protein